MSSVNVAIIFGSGSPIDILFPIIDSELRIQNSFMTEIVKVDPYSEYTGNPVIIKIILGASQEITIGDNAFKDFGTNITGELDLPKGVTAIGDYAFLNTEFNDILDLPAGLVTIGDGAFANVVFPTPGGAPVKWSGPNFKGGLIVPTSVTSIGQYAFAFSGFEDDLTVGGGTNLSIGLGAFLNTGFTGNLTLETGVETIGDSAFANISEDGKSVGVGPNFTGDLVIPSSVTSIGTAAFIYSGFTDGRLTINSTSLDIGAGAFSNTMFTGTLTLGTGVRTIGVGAFANVSEDGESVGVGPNFTGDLVIPNSVTSIGGGAFESSGFTGSLSIGNSITDINMSTFAGCNFTGSVTIPENVTIIGDTAITSNNISKIFLPSSIESLYTTSFEKINNVVIPCEMILNEGDSVSLTFANETTVTQTGNLPPGIVFSGNVLSGTVTSLSGIFTASFSASPTLTLTFLVGEQQVPCFLPISRIRMEDGTDKPVNQILAGDMVISAFSNTPVKVKHCGYTVVNFSDIEKTNLPYSIPGSYFSRDVPASTVYISGHHRIILNHATSGLIGVQTFKVVDDTNAITLEEQILKLSGSNAIRYYHIELEGGGNAVYSEGLAVETMDEGEWMKALFIEN
jgi:hypothetical protein